MRIDPKTYTLDANERHVICQALAMYRDAKVRRLAAIGRSSSTDLDSLRRSRECADMHLARAEDLLAALS